MDLCSLVSDIDGDVKGLWRLASCYSMRGWVLRSSRTPAILTQLTQVQAVDFILLDLLASCFADSNR